MNTSQHPLVLKYCIRTVIREGRWALFWQQLADRAGLPEESQARFRCHAAECRTCVRVALGDLADLSPRWQAALAPVIGRALPLDSYGICGS